MKWKILAIVCIAVFTALLKHEPVSYYVVRLLGFVVLGKLFIRFMLPRIKLHFRRRLKNKIVLRNNTLDPTTMPTDHFLDLDPAFVLRQQATKTDRVMSLSLYLASLIYDKEDTELGYMLITTISNSLGFGANLVPFLFPPQYVPQNENVVAKTGQLAKFTLAQFPSILVLAALVDGATSYFASKEDTLPIDMDAPDVFALGENPHVTPKMDQNMFKNLVLSPKDSTLRDIVRDSENMDMGPEPDVLHYFCPQPMSPLLLPGLCRGPGGLQKTCTPRQEFHSRALAAMFNKLSANVMAWLGYCTIKDQIPYQKFSIQLGDDNQRIFTCGEFLRKLVEIGGGRMEARIRSNLTSFGYELCVLDDESDMVFGDSVTVDQRERYTSIPLAFRTRTGVVSPYGGSDAAIHQLSSHSAVEWTFFDNALLADSELTITFYSGVEGFTGFKPGSEWKRPWVLESQSILPLNEQDAMRAMDFASSISVSSNMCVRAGSFPFGGYGGLGVCADSVAWVEHCLFGSTRIFPLVMRGDAKTLLLRVIHEEILKKLESGCGDNVHLAAFVKDMKLAAKSLVLLPNDIQVEPHQIQDSLFRISHSIFEHSPFMGDRFERSRLGKVRSGWQGILGNLGLWN